MSQLRRLFPLGSLVVLLGGAGMLWMQASRGPAPTAQAPAAPAPAAQAPAPLRCEWQAGQRVSYAGSHLLDSSFHLDASPTITMVAQGQPIPEQKNKVATSWLLDTEVEEVDAQGFATVAMRFRSFQVKDSSQEKAASVPGMEEPFLVRLSPRCGVDDFARRGGQDVEVAFQQQQTIASIQWSHAGDGRSSYQNRERDSMGEFSARYELSGRTLQRRRGSFDRMYGSHPRGETPSGRVQGPGQTITLAPGAWFASIEQDETIVLTLRDRTLATMTLRGKIEQAPAPEQAGALADARRSDWVWGWLLGDHKPRMDQALAPKDDPSLARMPVGQMIEQFSRMLGEQDVNKYVDFLASWIRSNPQRLGEMMTALKDRKFPSKYGHSAVFLALARAGTDEARAALLGVAQGRDWVGSDRKRASLALVEAGVLPRSFEQALTDGSRKEPEVYASVLGQAIRLQKDKDPAAAGRMRDALSDMLGDARSSGTQAQLLTAVRNTADPSFIPQVQAFTRSPDVDVRTDAYQALGSMPGSAADSHFIEALKNESSPKVRAAMVRAYAMQAMMQGSVSPALLAAATEALSFETSSDVKVELVALLGDAALRNDAAARAAIEGAFRAELAKPDAERNADLLAQMGKYVAARSKGRG